MGLDRNSVGNWVSMEKIKNLSLRTTIILYVVIVLFISTTLSFVLSRTAKEIQQNIWFKYTDQEEYNQMVENENGKNYLTQIPRIPSASMDKKDVIIVEVCDVIETWADLIISLVGSVIAVFVFYRNKISVPLKKLKEASRNIAENNLNFELKYDIHDEMGELCHEFEKMRRELDYHKKEMWNMLEDERTLRAAIAHDIRTPITVAKGNLEMLREFAPSGKLDEKKIIEMLEGAINNVGRLEYFTNIMRKLNSLLDIEPKFEQIKYAELLDKIKNISDILCYQKNKECEFYWNDESKVITVDIMAIQEVEENLVTNALRYAKKRISVTVELIDDLIILTVEDDGQGYQDDQQKLLQAYYKNSERDGTVHYGLGLYISKVLCSKHRGTLVLKNSKNGGAVARASFMLEN